MVDDGLIPSFNIWVCSRPWSTPQVTGGFPSDDVILGWLVGTIMDKPRWLIDGTSR